jgi:hypothetical protein
VTSGTPAAGNPASGIPDGFSRDPGYWYRRWVHAQERLDEEAAQRITHYVDMDRKVIDAACAGAVAAERARLFTAIRRKIPLSEPWRGRALDLIYEVWRETDG